MAALASWHCVVEMASSAARENGAVAAAARSNGGGKQCHFYRHRDSGEHVFICRRVVGIFALVKRWRAIIGLKATARRESPWRSEISSPHRRRAVAAWRALSTCRRPARETSVTKHCIRVNIRLLSRHGAYARGCGAARAVKNESRRALSGPSIGQRNGNSLRPSAFILRFL